MSSSTQALFQFAGLKPSLFAANSRYLGIEAATCTRDGRTIAYVRRRFIPQPGDLVQIQKHTVAQNDRLDVIAARYLADPELFWRICDANSAMRPEELVEVVGRSLRICLAEGIPGGSVAR